MPSTKRRTTWHRPTLVVSFAVVVMNLLIDLAYAFLDPRIRYS